MTLRFALGSFWKENSRTLLSKHEASSPTSCFSSFWHPSTDVQNSENHPTLQPQLYSLQISRLDSLLTKMLEPVPTGTHRPSVMISNMSDVVGWNSNLTWQIIQDYASVTVNTGGNLCNGHFNPIIQDLLLQYSCLAGSGVRFRMALLTIYKCTRTHAHAHSLTLTTWITERKVTKFLSWFFSK